MTIKTMEKALEALKQERDNYLDRGPEDGAPEYIYEAIRDLEFEVARQKQGEPVAWLLTDKNINSIQIDSVKHLIERAKYAHMTDIKLLAVFLSLKLFGKAWRAMRLNG